MPEEYEIKVIGHLDDALGQFFPGLAIMRLESGETLLSGSLPDQSALHGALERIRDLNLTLISVVRRSPPTQTHLPLIHE
jgi:hypothetical protein